MSEEKQQPPVWLTVLSVLIVTVGLLYYFDSSKQDRKEKINLCIETGVNFYKENTNSYPTFLSYPDKGRLTYDVVKERCQKNPKQFDDVK